jgi:hypothetical protein
MISASDQVATSQEFAIVIDKMRPKIVITYPFAEVVNWAFHEGYSLVALVSESGSMDGFADQLVNLGASDEEAKRAELGRDEVLKQIEQRVASLSEMATLLSALDGLRGERKTISAIFSETLSDIRAKKEESSDGDVQNDALADNSNNNKLDDKGESNENGSDAFDNSEGASMGEETTS